MHELDDDFDDDHMMDADEQVQLSPGGEEDHIELSSDDEADGVPAAQPQPRDKDGRPIHVGDVVQEIDWPSYGCGLVTDIIGSRPFKLIIQWHSNQAPAPRAGGHSPEHLGNMSLSAADRGDFSRIDKCPMCRQHFKREQSDEEEALSSDDVPEDSPDEEGAHL